MPSCVRPPHFLLSSFATSPESMRRSSTRHRLAGATVLVLVVFAAPATAQYKVIGPDGKVTYTDRAPNPTAAQVTPLGARAERQAPEPELPFELRQMASRYPVTLYVTPTACEPCNSGRQMLRQRGIPFNERLVATADDSEALEKLTGAREAPTLSVGSQILRGFAPEVWGSYLDAAGYPKASKLPAGYQYPPARPIVERHAAATPSTQPRAVPRAAAPAPISVAPPASGIRF